MKNGVLKVLARLINEKIITYIVIICFMIIVIPFVIDKFIIGNQFKSNVSNEVWMGFLGSYIGAIIGALVTLIGVNKTIAFTMKQSSEDRRLSIMPYVKWIYYDSSQYKVKYVSELKFCFSDDNSYTYVTQKYLIKNTGLGALRDLTFEGIEFNHKGYKSSIRMLGEILEKGDSLLLIISIGVNHKDRNDPNKDIYLDTGEGSFKIIFKDLMGNQYEQVLKLVYTIGLGKSFEVVNPQICLYEIGEIELVK